jgi:hypothetical protein
LESKNNIGFGHTSVAKFFGNIDFSAIILYPNFLVDNVKVENTAIDTPLIFPTDIDNLVMISLSVKVTLGVDVLGGTAAAIGYPLDNDL